MWVQAHVSLPLPQVARSPHATASRRASTAFLMLLSPVLTRPEIFPWKSGYSFLPNIQVVPLLGAPGMTAAALRYNNTLGQQRLQQELFWWLQTRPGKISELMTTPVPNRVVKISINSNFPTVSGLPAEIPFCVIKGRSGDCDRRR